MKHEGALRGTNVGGEKTKDGEAKKSDDVARIESEI